MSDTVDFAEADAIAQAWNLPDSLGGCFPDVAQLARAYLALRTEVAAVRAEERARCVGIVKGLTPEMLMDWNGMTFAEVLMRTDVLAALTGGPHE